MSHHVERKLDLGEYVIEELLGEGGFGKVF